MQPEKLKDGDDAGGGGSLMRSAKSGNVERLITLLDDERIAINTANPSGLNCLHLAAKEGHTQIVKELIKRNIPVNHPTKRGNTALHIAALAGKLDVIKVLIENGADANAMAQNAFTPLYMASQEGHDEIVDYLLKNGANQSISTEDGFTPLAVALQEGKDKVVALLLDNDVKGRVKLPALHIAARKDDVKAAALLLQNDHSADVTSKRMVNRTTESGFTALHIAAHYGNVNVASLLLNRGAAHDFTARNGITPLHVACKRGHTRFCALLLDRDANLDARTKDGLSPLHCAARSGHEPVVKLLMERMTTKDSIPRTKNGLSALHMAAQGGHVSVVELLLAHDYPVDDATLDYLTALHIAAHCGHEKVARVLLTKNARVDGQAMNGFTPLHVASKKNQIKIVVLLLKHGANTEAITESGLTPLHVACFMGHFEIVKILMEKGAVLNTVNNRGETALHMATRSGQEETVKYLLDHGARPDARKKESQTALHLAARLDKLAIARILLQHGAVVDEMMRDGYTPLHVASKEGHVEICALLLEKGAAVSLTTKKGFTPLHLAAKYGRLEVSSLLLKKFASPDPCGKDGLTPLHVAAHYDNQNVALLLLKNGASPHASAKNAYTPLHIAAKKNQIDIAVTLLEYGASSKCKTRMDATPLHLAAQAGHTDMCSLLLAKDANVNETAKHGLTPMHLAAEEDNVSVAKVLYDNGSLVDPLTKGGYTPLHVACHHGNVKMVKYLLSLGAKVNAKTKNGYTALHLAAQQGHTQLVDILLKFGASPNELTNSGNTALSLAKRLGYITVCDTLTTVTTEIIETSVAEKHKMNVPETFTEGFMSDASDDEEEDGVAGEGGYLTGKELQELGDDSIMPTDANILMSGRDGKYSTLDHLSMAEKRNSWNSSLGESDNLAARDRRSSGFLVSFMVDARGGMMCGSRHPDLRVIVPPNSCGAPTRITCRLARRQQRNRSSANAMSGGIPLFEEEGKAARILELGGKGTSFLDKMHLPARLPPLNEGEFLASRVLQLGPKSNKFIGPIAIEIPHFANLHGREREIVILRSDDGESWKEHRHGCSDEKFLQQMEGTNLETSKVLAQRRVVRVITKDLPRYFALYSRTREDICQVGPDGGILTSTVDQNASATFPKDALTKEIKVGIQVRPIQHDMCKRAVGMKAKASPIVTVEPRRRKFHRPITLAIPLPEGSKMKDYLKSSEDPTLRLLCSIAGGNDPAQWEDITGSTPLTFNDSSVSFTTTVSAKFWLMDCSQTAESTSFAERIYTEAMHVPYLAKFVVLAKSTEPTDAQVRVFCLTDDKYERTLESQEHFMEIARSRDVEVLNTSPVYVECTGNLIINRQSQPTCTFAPFRENRLHFPVKVRDMTQEPCGRLAFYRDARGAKVHGARKPLCSLNITLPPCTKEVDSDDESPEEPLRNGKPTEFNSQLTVIQARERYYLVDPSSVDVFDREDSTPEEIAKDVAEVMEKLSKVKQILDPEEKIITSPVDEDARESQSGGVPRSASMEETTQVVLEVKDSLTVVKDLLESEEELDVDSEPEDERDRAKEEPRFAPSSIKSESVVKKEVKKNGTRNEPPTYDSHVKKEKGEERIKEETKVVPTSPKGEVIRKQEVKKVEIVKEFPLHQTDRANEFQKDDRRMTSDWSMMVTKTAKVETFAEKRIVIGSAKHKEEKRSGAHVADLKNMFEARSNSPITVDMKESPHAHRETDVKTTTTDHSATVSKITDEFDSLSEKITCEIKKPAYVPLAEDNNKIKEDDMSRYDILDQLARALSNDLDKNREHLQITHPSITNEIAEGHIKSPDSGPKPVHNVRPTDVDALAAFLAHDMANDTQPQTGDNHSKGQDEVIAENIKLLESFNDSKDPGKSVRFDENVMVHNGSISKRADANFGEKTKPTSPLEQGAAEQQSVLQRIKAYEEAREQLDIEVEKFRQITSLESEMLHQKARLHALFPEDEQGGQTSLMLDEAYGKDGDGKKTSPVVVEETHSIQELFCTWETSPEKIAKFRSNTPSPKKWKQGVAHSSSSSFESSSSSEHATLEKKPTPYSALSKPSEIHSTRHHMSQISNRSYHIDVVQDDGSKSSDESLLSSEESRSESGNEDDITPREKIDLHIVETDIHLEEEGYVRESLQKIGKNVIQKDMDTSYKGADNVPILDEDDRDGIITDNNNSRGEFAATEHITQLTSTTERITEHDNGRVYVPTTEMRSHETLIEQPSHFVYEDAEVHEETFTTTDDVTTPDLTDVESIESGSSLGFEHSKPAPYLETPDYMEEGSSDDESSESEEELTARRVQDFSPKQPLSHADSLDDVHAENRTIQKSQPIGFHPELVSGQQSHPVVSVTAAEDQKVTADDQGGSQDDESTRSPIQHVKIPLLKFSSSEEFYHDPNSGEVDLAYEVAEKSDDAKVEHHDPVAKQHIFQEKGQDHELQSSSDSDEESEGIYQIPSKEKTADQHSYVFHQHSADTPTEAFVKVVEISHKEEASYQEGDEQHQEESKNDKQHDLNQHPPHIASETSIKAVEILHLEEVIPLKHDVLEKLHEKEESLSSNNSVVKEVPGKHTPQPAAMVTAATSTQKSSQIAISSTVTHGQEEREQDSEYYGFEVGKEKDVFPPTVFDDDGAKLVDVSTKFEEDQSKASLTQFNEDKAGAESPDPTKAVMQAHERDTKVSSSHVLSGYTESDPHTDCQTFDDRAINNEVNTARSSTDSGVHHEELQKTPPSHCSLEYRGMTETVPCLTGELSEDGGTWDESTHDVDLWHSKEPTQEEALGHAGTESLENKTVLPSQDSGDLYQKQILKTESTDQTFSFTETESDLWCSQKQIQDEAIVSHAGAESSDNRIVLSSQGSGDLYQKEILKTESTNETSALSETESDLWCSQKQTQDEALVSHVGTDSLEDRIVLSLQDSGDLYHEKILDTQSTDQTSALSETESDLWCSKKQAEDEALVSHAGTDSMENTIVLSSQDSGDLYHGKILKAASTNETSALSETESDLWCSQKQTQDEALVSHAGTESSENRIVLSSQDGGDLYLEKILDTESTNETSALSETESMEHIMHEHQTFSVEDHKEEIIAATSHDNAFTEWRDETHTDEHANYLEPYLDYDMSKFHTEKAKSAEIENVVSKESVTATSTQWFKNTLSDGVNGGNVAVEESHLHADKFYSEYSTSTESKSDEENANQEGDAKWYHDESGYNNYTKQPTLPCDTSLESTSGQASTQEKTLEEAKHEVLHDTQQQAIEITSQVVDDGQFEKDSTPEIKMQAEEKTNEKEPKAILELKGSLQYENIAASNIQVSLKETETLQAQLDDHDEIKSQNEEMFEQVPQVASDDEDVSIGYSSQEEDQLIDGSVHIALQVQGSPPHVHEEKYHRDEGTVRHDLHVQPNLYEPESHKSDELSQASFHDELKNHGHETTYELLHHHEDTHIQHDEPVIQEEWQTYESDGNRGEFEPDDQTSTIHSEQQGDIMNQAEAFGDQQHPKSVDQYATCAHPVQETLEILDDVSCEKNVDHEECAHGARSSIQEEFSHLHHDEYITDTEITKGDSRTTTAYEGEEDVCFTDNVRDEACLNELKTSENAKQDDFLLNEGSQDGYMVKNWYDEVTAQENKYKLAQEEEEEPYYVSTSEDGTYLHATPVQHPDQDEVLRDSSEKYSYTQEHLDEHKDSSHQYQEEIHAQLHGPRSRSQQQSDAEEAYRQLVQEELSDLEMTTASVEESLRRDEHVYSLTTKKETEMKHEEEDSHVHDEDEQEMHPGYGQSSLHESPLAESHTLTEITDYRSHEADMPDAQAEGFAIHSDVQDQLMHEQQDDDDLYDFRLTGQGYEEEDQVREISSCYAGDDYPDDPYQSDDCDFSLKRPKTEHHGNIDYGAPMEQSNVSISQQEKSRILDVLQQCDSTNIEEESAQDVHQADQSLTSTSINNSGPAKMGVKTIEALEPSCVPTKQQEVLARLDKKDMASPTEQERWDDYESDSYYLPSDLSSEEEDVHSNVILHENEHVNLDVQEDGVECRLPSYEEIHGLQHSFTKDEGIVSEAIKQEDHAESYAVQSSLTEGVHQHPKASHPEISQKQECERHEYFSHHRDTADPDILKQKYHESDEDCHGHRETSQPEFPSHGDQGLDEDFYDHHGTSYPEIRPEQEDLKMDEDGRTHHEMSRRQVPPKQEYDSDEDSYSTTSSEEESDEYPVDRERPLSRYDDSETRQEYHREESTCKHTEPANNTFQQEHIGYSETSSVTTYINPTYGMPEKEMASNKPVTPGREEYEMIHEENLRTSGIHEDGKYHHDLEYHRDVSETHETPRSSAQDFELYAEVRKEESLHASLFRQQSSEDGNCLFRSRHLALLSADDGDDAGSESTLVPDYDGSTLKSEITFSDIENFIENKTTGDEDITHEEHQKSSGPEEGIQAEDDNIPMEGTHVSIDIADSSSLHPAEILHRERKVVFGGVEHFGEEDDVFVEEQRNDLAAKLMTDAITNATTEVRTTIENEEIVDKLAEDLTDDVLATAVGEVDMDSLDSSDNDSDADSSDGAEHYYVLQTGESHQDDMDDEEDPDESALDHGETRVPQSSFDSSYDTLWQRAEESKTRKGSGKLMLSMEEELKKIFGRKLDEDSEETLHASIEKSFETRHEISPLSKPNYESELQMLGRSMEEVFDSPRSSPPRNPIESIQSESQVTVAGEGLNIGYSIVTTCQYGSGFLQNVTYSKEASSIHKESLLSTGIQSDGMNLHAQKTYSESHQTQDSLLQGSQEDSAGIYSSQLSGSMHPSDPIPLVPSAPAEHLILQENLHESTFLEHTTTTTPSYGTNNLVYGYNTTNFTPTCEVYTNYYSDDTTKTTESYMTGMSFQNHGAKDVEPDSSLGEEQENMEEDLTAVSSSSPIVLNDVQKELSEIKASREVHSTNPFKDYIASSESSDEEEPNWFDHPFDGGKAPPGELPGEREKNTSDHKAHLTKFAETNAASLDRALTFEEDDTESDTTSTTYSDSDEADEVSRLMKEAEMEAIELSKVDMFVMNPQEPPKQEEQQGIASSPNVIPVFQEEDSFTCMNRHVSPGDEDASRGAEWNTQAASSAGGGPADEELWNAGSTGVHHADVHQAGGVKQESASRIQHGTSWTGTEQEFMNYSKHSIGDSHLHDGQWSQTTDEDTESVCTVTSQTFEHTSHSISHTSELARPVTIANKAALPGPTTYTTPGTDAGAEADYPHRDEYENISSSSSSSPSESSSSTTDDEFDIFAEKRASPEEEGIHYTLETCFQGENDSAVSEEAQAFDLKQDSNFLLNEAQESWEPRPLSPVPPDNDAPEDEVTLDVPQEEEVPKNFQLYFADCIDISAIVETVHMQKTGDPPNRGMSDTYIRTPESEEEGDSLMSAEKSPTSRDAGKLSPRSKIPVAQSQTLPRAKRTRQGVLLSDSNCYSEDPIVKLQTELSAAKQSRIPVRRSVSQPMACKTITKKTKSRKTFAGSPTSVKSMPTKQKSPSMSRSSSGESISKRSQPSPSNHRLWFASTTDSSSGGAEKYIELRNGVYTYKGSPEEEMKMKQQKFRRWSKETPGSPVSPSGSSCSSKRDSVASVVFTPDENKGFLDPGANASSKSRTKSYQSSTPYALDLNLDSTKMSQSTRITTSKHIESRYHTVPRTEKLTLVKSPIQNLQMSEVPPQRRNEELQAISVVGSGGVEEVLEFTSTIPLVHGTRSMSQSQRFSGNTNHFLSESLDLCPASVGADPGINFGDNDDMTMLPSDFESPFTQKSARFFESHASTEFTTYSSHTNEESASHPKEVSYESSACARVQDTESSTHPTHNSEFATYASLLNEESTTYGKHASHECSTDVHHTETSTYSSVVSDNRELRLHSISSQLGTQWLELAKELGVSDEDVWQVQKECQDAEPGEKSFCMLLVWLERNRKEENKDVELKDALEKIGRKDLADKLDTSISYGPLDHSAQMDNQMQFDNSGFNALAEELGSPHPTFSHVSSPYPFKNEQQTHEMSPLATSQAKEEKSPSQPAPLYSVQSEDEDDPNKPHFVYMEAGDGTLSPRKSEADEVFKSPEKKASSTSSSDDEKEVKEVTIRQEFVDQQDQGHESVESYTFTETKSTTTQVNGVQEISTTTITRTLVVDADQANDIDIAATEVKVSGEESGTIEVTRQVTKQVIEEERKRSSSESSESKSSSSSDEG